MILTKGESISQAREEETRPCPMLHPRFSSRFYLGSANTTLLNRILSETHGK